MATASCAVQRTFWPRLYAVVLTLPAAPLTRAPPVDIRVVMHVADGVLQPHGQPLVNTCTVMSTLLQAWSMRERNTSLHRETSTLLWMVSSDGQHC